MIIAFAENLHTTPRDVLYNYSYTNLVLYTRHLIAGDEGDEGDEEVTDDRQMTDLLTT